jgi:uncharacterized membrane protein
MNSSELRANARMALQGKWGKSALLTLCFMVITWVISFVLTKIPYVGGILQFIVSLPMSFGFLAVFMKLKRDENVGYTDFITIGFENFAKVWRVFGNMVLKTIVPLILVIVFMVVYVLGVGISYFNLTTTTSYNYTTQVSSSSSFSFLAFIGLIGYIASFIYFIVKVYLYSLSFYILYDNPDKSGREIVEESASLMQGHRWAFFWLSLTFIGWVILSAFTLYIGMLWVMPYIMVTFVCFYETLANVSYTQNVEDDDNTINPMIEK